MRALCWTVLAAVALLSQAVATAEEISGDYLETRTCDVYTGPCFANGQVGLTGRDALLAWSIDRGSFNGVDLAGHKVVMAVRASDTLGFGGGMVVRPDPIRSVVLVDREASPAQRDALVAFAKSRAGRLAGEVTRVESVAIDMTLDHIDMVAKLTAGKVAHIETRKLGKGDCVCTNEMIFYPPLTDVDSYEPAYTVEAGYQGRGLGSRWQAPRTRSSFLATFNVKTEELVAR